MEAVCVLTSITWDQGKSITEEQAHRILYMMAALYRRGVLAALRASDTGRSEAEDDDSFSRELQAAYAQNDADGYARVLSGRLRQMDKRAKAANVRADQTEVRLRLMRVRAEAAEAERLAARAALNPPAGQGETRS